MTIYRKTLLTFVLVCKSTSGLIAAECPPIYTFSGELFSDRFGWNLSGKGDITNDGFDDILVGANHYTTIGFAAGRSYVYSGINGDTVYINTGLDTAISFGFGVAIVGDINNDGYDDYIVGASRFKQDPFEPGRAYIYSGKTNNTLYVLTGDLKVDQQFFGSSVAGVGDLNLDGFDDFIIGASGNSEVGHWAGRAYVFSGFDADTLFVFAGGSADDLFGIEVGSAGLIDGDTIPDIIIGAVRNDAGGMDAGRVYVFSGATGDTLYKFTGEQAEDFFGFSIASAGDVNNDGRDDLIIGAIQKEIGGAIVGRVYVFSGLNGDTLHILDGENDGDFFGYSVTGLGDINGDNFDDFAIGAIGFDVDGSFAGKIYVISGSDGVTLFTFTGTSIKKLLGIALSAGNVTGSDVLELIVGEQNSVEVFSLVDSDNDGTPDQCDICPGFDDTLDSDGDGAPDGCDICPGFDDNIDTDNDGIPDGCDVCCDIPGDADGGGDINIGDAIFIVKYAFEEGSPAPPCCDQADADGGGDVNIGDAIYIVKFAFEQGSPAPACPNPGGLVCP